jgi:hypothetical protein
MQPGAIIADPRHGTPIPPRPLPVNRTFPSAAVSAKHDVEFPNSKRAIRSTSKITIFKRLEPGVG